MYAYQNLKKPINTSSGIADYALLAPVYDFAPNGIKCPEAPFANPGDEVKIQNPHVFLADKGFAKFALSPNKNQITAKTIGETGSQKFDFESKIFVPGSYAEVHEAMKNLLNTPLIYLHKDSSCGSDFYYQLGCDCVYAYIKADFSTGTTKDGVKGYELTVTYQNDCVLMYTAGTAGITVLGD